MPAIGDRLGPRIVDPVDGRAMHVLAEILDDANPIHLDPAAAAAAGLGDRQVNQGPANFGYIIDMLLKSVPAARLETLEVRLLGNVFAGDRVIAAGEVVSISGDHSDARRAECNVWLDVDGGGRVLEGSAVLRLPAGV